MYKTDPRLWESFGPLELEIFIYISPFDMLLTLSIPIQTFISQMRDMFNGYKLKQLFVKLKVLRAFHNVIVSFN